jgi:hypothetical protein
MKTLILTSIIILFLHYSYSQEILKIEKVTEKSVVDDCMCINMERYFLFALYFCNFEKVVQTSLVKDTIKTVCEYEMEFYFTDTLDYFIIKKASKMFPRGEFGLNLNTSEHIAQKKYEEIAIQLLNNATVYYEITKQRDFLRKRYFIAMLIYLIPEKKRE